MLKPLPDPVETTVEVVAHDSNRLSGSPCYLSSSEPVEVSEFDRTSLPWLQIAEELLDQNPIFETGKAVASRLGGLRRELFKRLRFRYVRGDQCSAPIQCSMVGEHEQPGPEASFGCIELRDGSEDIEEEFLDCIFSFRSIPKDAAGDAENERVIALEQSCQCVAVSGAQLARKLLVRAQEI